MGILNVTPDSFSDGGAFFEPEAAVTHGIRMAQEGADLLDVGGVSTRPGARSVPLEEELRRVMPIVARLVKAVRIPICVDTSSAAVAQRALEAGASIVNDVTALRHDADMARVIARGKAAVILMHMRGTPATMQRRPRYRDVVNDVITFLRRAAACAQEAGIARSRILVDPGLGFGKTVTHNLALLRALPALASCGYGVVIGPSRKSFIGTILDAPLEDRLAGTLACVAHAQRGGAAIVRVHEVKPAVDLLRMLGAIEHGTTTHDS